MLCPAELWLWRWSGSCGAAFAKQFKHSHRAGASGAAVTCEDAESRQLRFNPLLVEASPLAGLARNVGSTLACFIGGWLEPELVGLFVLSNGLLHSGALGRLRELLASPRIRNPSQLMVVFGFVVAPISGFIPTPRSWRSNRRQPPGLKP